MAEVDLDALEARLSPRPGRREPDWDTDDAERWLRDLIAECRRLKRVVALAGRWDDHLSGCRMWRHEVERVGTLRICSGRDTLVADEECLCGYEEFRAALDEAPAALLREP